MPRTARIKTDNSIYHIMVRSISDTLLYKCNEDKFRYLKLIKKYQDIFEFKVYAYCIMNTHAHIIIDCCGADISKIMHSINQCYAQYYNKKYNRHGHLFQDRFKSKIVYNDSYLITLSGYIHNNPSDIKEYKNRVEMYNFSSLGIYLGTRADTLNLVDANFVMQQFSTDKSNAKIKYLKFVSTCNEERIEKEIKKSSDNSLCLSERKIISRNINPLTIIDCIEKSNITNTLSKGQLKSISILLLRRFCNLSYVEIRKFLGISNCSNINELCFNGANILSSKSEYKNIIDNIV